MFVLAVISQAHELIRHSFLYIDIAGGVPLPPRHATPHACSEPCRRDRLQSQLALYPVAMFVLAFKHLPKRLLKFACGFYRAKSATGYSAVEGLRDPRRSHGTDRPRVALVHALGFCKQDGLDMRTTHRHK